MVWCTVGGQAVAGWPKVIQVVPGVVDSDAAVWRAEADTAARPSQLVGSSSAVDRHGTVQIVRPREVLGMQREADSLRQRLAKYEEAAAGHGGGGGVGGGPETRGARRGVSRRKRSQRLVEVTAGRP